MSTIKVISFQVLIHLRLSPLQIIFTPAMLSIRTDKIILTPSQMVHVPRINFDVTKFTSLSNTKYSGYSTLVKGLVITTCMSGTINPFIAPASNASWSLDFYGPSLSCAPVDTLLYSAIRDNLWTAFEYGKLSQLNTDDFRYPTGFYIPWTPKVDRLPYHFPSNVQVMIYPNRAVTDQSSFYNISFEDRSLGPFSNHTPGLSALEDEMELPATLFFAVAEGKRRIGMDNLTVIQCELRNSS